MTRTPKPSRATRVLTHSSGSTLVYSKTPLHTVHTKFNAMLDSESPSCIEFESPLTNDGSTLTVNDWQRFINTSGFIPVSYHTARQR